MARTTTASHEYTDENGNIIRTSGAPKEGGEGSVYNVKGKPNLVVKIYNDKKISNVVEYNKLINKLKTMCDMADDSIIKKAAWPQKIVYSHNRPVGFVMNKIKYGNTFHQLVDTVDRKEKFKNNNEWKFLFYVARNLAYAFHSLHSKGVVIGDVNESNFLIGNVALAEKDGVVDYQNNGIVYCIDCDSFQIIKGQTKFLCTVNKREYAPPEIINLDLHSIIRTPNQDNFGLAVMIFQLLMLGRHPYAGRGVPGDIREAIYGGYFAYGVNSHKRQIYPPQPSEMYLMIYNSLNNEIKSLFEQAFSPDKNVWRPTAKEWAEALDRQIAELVHCSKNGGHFYDKDGECIWCKIKKMYNYEFWTFNKNSSYSQIQYSFAKSNLKGTQKQTQTTYNSGVNAKQQQTAQPSSNTNNTTQQNYNSAANTNSNTSQTSQNTANTNTYSSASQTSQNTANTNTYTNTSQASQNTANTNTYTNTSQASQNTANTSYTQNTQNYNSNSSSTIWDWLIVYPIGIVIFLFTEIFKLIKRRPVVSIIIALVLLFYFIGASEDNNKTSNPPVSNNTVVSTETENNRQETENLEAEEENSTPVYTEEQKKADIDEYKKKFIARVKSHWDPGHESFYIDTNSSLEAIVDRDGNVKLPEYDADWTDAVKVAMKNAIQYDGAYDHLPDSYDGDTLSFRIYFEGNDGAPKSSYKVSLTPIKVSEPTPVTVEKQETKAASTAAQKQSLPPANSSAVKPQNKTAPQSTKTNTTNSTNISQQQPKEQKKEQKTTEPKKEKTDLQKSSDYFFE